MNRKAAIYVRISEDRESRGGAGLGVKRQEVVVRHKTGYVAE